MSSNIRIQRICEFCNNEFTAKTTVTKYCSGICAKKAYKERKRKDKIKTSNKETKRIVTLPIELLKSKEFLNITEVSELIGISKRTVYRLIENQKLTKLKIGTRTIIRRSDLDELLSTGS